MSSKKKTIKEEVFEDIFGKVINCDKLRVRSKPSLDADIVSVIDKNETLKITGTSKNKIFYKIVTSFGLEGYVQKLFVERI